MFRKKKSHNQGRVEGGGELEENNGRGLERMERKI